MEQHAVVGDDLLGLVELAGAALRVAAAQVTGRQHGLHSDVPQHRLRREADLREQSLRAAAGKIEHGIRLAAGARRIANDRHVVTILDIEQRARRLLRQAARHFLVHEMHDLLFQRRLAGRRRRPRRLRARERAQHAIAEPLRLEAPFEHHLARELDRLGIGRVEEDHRCGGAGVEALLAHASQQVAHRHRHVAEVDVDRTRLLALVADGAVIRDVGELVEVADGDAAARLLLVQERLDQQRGRENLVARRVEQVGARHVRRADRLALATAQAVLDGVRDRVDVGVLHDQRLVPEQIEAGRVGVAQVAVGQELAAIETTLRIDALLVIAELGGLRVRSGTPAW